MATNARQNQGFGGEKRPYGDKKPSFGGKTGFRSAEKRPYGGNNGERRPYPPRPAAPKVEGSDGLPARRLALEVIRAVTENDAYASLVLDEKLNKCTRRWLTAVWRRGWCTTRWSTC